MKNHMSGDPMLSAKDSPFSLVFLLMPVCSDCWNMTLDLLICLSPETMVRVSPLIPEYTES